MNTSPLIHNAERADLIFVGGNVHTVGPNNDIAEALAVAGDRILCSGRSAEVRALAGPSTRIVELRGRSVLPGMIDAHCHVVTLGAVDAEIDCAAPGMRSIAAIVEAVRQRATELPSGDWIRARGYDQARLAERRHPNRFDLDPVSSDHPVVVSRICGHVLVLNSRAMALAGINDRSPDPPGGRFDHSAGHNLGIAYEDATAPFRQASALSAKELSDALQRGNRRLLAAGVTSAHDAGGLSGPAFEIAQDLLAQAKLQLRMHAMLPVGCGDDTGLIYLASGRRPGSGDDRLRLGSFKIFADGSIGARTAATRQPYASDPSTCGLLSYRQDEIDALLNRAHRAGFQITLHAIGDRAVEQGLTGIERALQDAPRNNARPRVEHCAVCPADLQARVRRLGVIPVMQPGFFWEFGDTYLESLGAERAATMFPLRSLIGAGVPVACGSDAPVADIRPLFGIWQAMTRRTASGQLCGESERVDLTTAIRTYTINAAYASHEEDRKGSLEPGKLADLVVLDDDLSRVPIDRIPDVGVAVTVVGGRIAYEA